MSEFILQPNIYRTGARQHMQVDMTDNKINQLKRIASASGGGLAFSEAFRNWILYNDNTKYHILLSQSELQQLSHVAFADIVSQFSDNNLIRAVERSGLNDDMSLSGFLKAVHILTEARGLTENQDKCETCEKEISYEWVYCPFCGQVC